MPSVWEVVWWWAGGVSRRGSGATSTSSQGHPNIILTHKYVVEIVGVLCYQLFTANYFPWHLYPLMLNRAAELLSLIFSRGHILAAYSIAQVCLSALSLTIFSKKQPCGRTNCIGPLILYTISLSYEIFVALIVGKLSRMPMADDEGQIVANWPPHVASPDGRGLLGIQIIGMLPRRMRARVISRVPEDEVSPSRPTLRKVMDMELHSDIILAVEQPDGEKISIARLCKGPIINDTSINSQSQPSLQKSLQDMLETTRAIDIVSHVSQEVDKFEEHVALDIETPNNLMQLQHEQADEESS